MEVTGHMVLLLAGIAFLAVAVVLLVLTRAARSARRALLRQEPSTVAELRQLCDAGREQVGPGYYAEMVEVKGQAVDQEALRAPLTGAPCVAFRYEVNREFETAEQYTDDKGRRQSRTVQKSETVAQDEQRTDFRLDDGAGVIAVAPAGAELIEQTTLDQFLGGDATPPAHGPLDLDDLLRRQPRLGHGSRQRGYRYRERIIPTGAPLYILGEASDRGGDLTIGRPSAGGRFMISVKSEEQLASSYETRAKWLSFSAVAAAAAGVTVLILAAVLTTR